MDLKRLRTAVVVGADADVQVNVRPRLVLEVEAVSVVRRAGPAARHRHVPTPIRDGP